MTTREQHVVRLEPALHGARVEAVGRIHHKRVHLLLGKHRVQRVGELNLAAHPRLHIGQQLHHAGREQVAAEHRQIRRRIL